MGNIIASDRCKFQASFWSRCSGAGISPGGYCNLHGCYECGESVSLGGWEKKESIPYTITRPVTSLFVKDSPFDIMWRVHSLCEKCENLEKYPRCGGCNNQYARLVQPGDRCGMGTCK